jgi:hypothetical protein
LYSQNLKKEKASTYVNSQAPTNFVETKESATGFVEAAPVKKSEETEAPRKSREKSPAEPRATAKPKPSAESSEGRVMISTVPSDSKIFLNEVYSGNSPLFKKVKAGFYAVKITKEGYSTYRAALRIASGETKPLSVKLLGQ